jgi:hypothetical protein
LGFGISCGKIGLTLTPSELRNRLADLLQQVVDGKWNAGDALDTCESWTDAPWEEREVNDAWHTLMHFNIDQDIRLKDPNYDSSMRQALVKHIFILRAA